MRQGPQQTFYRFCSSLAACPSISNYNKAMAILRDRIAGSMDLKPDRQRNLRGSGGTFRIGADASALAGLFGDFA